METMIGFIVLFFLAVALSHLNHVPCAFVRSSRTRAIIFLSVANIAGLISLFFAFSQLGKCVESIEMIDHATEIKGILSVIIYYLMVIKA